VSGVYGPIDAATGGFAVVHGRFFTTEEMAGETAVAVISHNLAAELVGASSLVSALKTPLMLQGQPWRIVGVLEEAADLPTFNVFVPVGSLGHAGSASPTVLGALPGGTRSLFVRAPRIEDVLDVKARVEKWVDATDRLWRQQDQVTVASQGSERVPMLFKTCWRRSSAARSKRRSLPISYRARKRYRMRNATASSSSSGDRVNRVVDHAEYRYFFCRAARGVAAGHLRFCFQGKRPSRAGGHRRRLHAQDLRGCTPPRMDAGDYRIAPSAVVFSSPAGLARTASLGSFANACSRR